jgi:hypothetical protein
VGFVVDGVALGQVPTPPVLLLSSIVPPTIHTQLCLHVALTAKTNGRSLGAFKKQRYFRNLDALSRKVLLTAFSLDSAVS